MGGWGVCIGGVVMWGGSKGGGWVGQVDMLLGRKVRLFVCRVVQHVLHM